MTIAPYTNGLTHQVDTYLKENPRALPEDTLAIVVRRYPRMPPDRQATIHRGILKVLESPRHAPLLR